MHTMFIGRGDEVVGKKEIVSMQEDLMFCLIWEQWKFSVLLCMMALGASADVF